MSALGSPDSGIRNCLITVSSSTSSSSRTIHKVSVKLLFSQLAAVILIVVSVKLAIVRLVCFTIVNCFIIHILELIYCTVVV